MAPAISVVGAGLVGATAALSLSKRFPDYQVDWMDRGTIEPTPAATDFDSRVIACTPGSQAYLESLGVWSHLPAERIQGYQSMRVWDQQGGASIEFQASEVNASRLGAIVEVNALLCALYAQISQRVNIRLWPETQVADLTEVVGNQRSLILSSGESLSSSLVIGADGSRSSLRELAKIKTRIRAMGQTAMVAVVSHQYEHRHTAWQAFGKHGPLAFLPLPDGEKGEHQSAIVWSLDDAIAAENCQLGDTELMPLLEAGIGGRLGAILKIRYRAAFPLNQLHAKHYVLPGLCLLGDAIHTLHPLAGQGANLGFRDIAALDKELHRAQQRQVWIGDQSILRRYERARKLENLTMLAGMEAFRHGFGSRLSVLRWLCNRGLQRVDHWRSLKGYIARQAMH